MASRMWMQGRGGRVSREGEAACQGTAASESWPRGLDTEHDPDAKRDARMARPPPDSTGSERARSVLGWPAARSAALGLHTQGVTPGPESRWSQSRGRVFISRTDGVLGEKKADAAQTDGIEVNCKPPS